MSDDQTELLKIGDKVADLVHKLAGPMAEEVGLMFGDRVRVYRVKNWIETLKKTDQLLSDAGIPPNAVPPRLLLPIMESSSLEDNDSLQQLWAGLLATASQQTDSVMPSFVETLKQLTPDEAKHLEHVYKTLQDSRKNISGMEMSITPYAFTDRWGAPSGVSSDNYERLGLIRRDFDVKLGSRSVWTGEPSSIDEVLDAVDKALDAAKPEIGYLFRFTKFAVNFLEACHGPQPASPKEPVPE